VLAERVEVDRRAERAADEARDLMGAAADLAAARLPVAAGVGGTGEHLVLGGDPAGSVALHPPGHTLGEARGAQHTGPPELDEHTALGVVEPVPRHAH